jgi:hypothetical protein
LNGSEVTIWFGTGSIEGKFYIDDVCIKILFTKNQDFTEEGDSSLSFFLQKDEDDFESKLIIGGSRPTYYEKILYLASTSPTPMFGELA